MAASYRIFTPKIFKSFLIAGLFFLLPNFTHAASYYISPTGSDSSSGLSVDTPLATFTYAQSLMSAGDTLILMDGTYAQALDITISGTAGNPVTFQAQNRGAAIIAPTSAGIALKLESTISNIKKYVTIDGLIIRGNGDYSAVRIGHTSDNVAEENQGGHYIIKNVGVFGSGNYTEAHVIAVGQVTDSLFEDIFAYGFGRKAFQAYGCHRITVRRAIVRYDFWDGESKPNDPRIGFAIYNTHDGLYEDIISLDNAPDPTAALTRDGIARSSASKAAFAVEGNVSSTVITLGAQGNTWKGILGMNTYGNGSGSGNGLYSSGVSTGQNSGNTIVDAIFWGNMGTGFNFLAQTLNNSVSHMTSNNNGRHGIYFGDTYATGNTITNFVTKSNTLYGISDASYGANTLSSYSSLLNGSGTTVEAAYAPTYNYLVEPNMVDGQERGGKMVNRYVDGVLTSTSLWPWPNEDLIRQYMCNSTDLATVHRVAANGVGWEPAWCASGKTLTTYIWEYLGNQIPSYIYEQEQDVVAPSPPQSLNVQ